MCKTKSFDSFFVREMTHLGLKCVTLVPVCHLTDKKMSQVTQFHIVTHCDVFCVRVDNGLLFFKEKQQQNYVRYSHIKSKLRLQMYEQTK